MKPRPLLDSVIASIDAGRILPATRDLIAALIEDAETRAAFVTLLERQSFKKPGPKDGKLDEQADARNLFLDLRKQYGSREARLRIKAEAPEHFEAAINPNGRVRAYAREKKNRTNNLSGLFVGKNAD